MKQTPIFVFLVAVILAVGCNHDSLPPINAVALECVLRHTPVTLEDEPPKYQTVIIGFCRFDGGIEECADLQAPITSFAITKIEDTGVFNPFGLPQRHITFQIKPLPDGEWRTFFCGMNQCLGPEGKSSLHFTSPRGSFNIGLSVTGWEEDLGYCKIVEGV